MRKKIISIAIVFFSLGFSTVLFAQEKEVQPTIMFAAKEAKAKTVGTIAIFLNGNDPLLMRIVEDAFAIHLANGGFAVINREVLEKSVGEQVAKMRKDKSDRAINALEVSRALDANSIITGTLIVVESGEQSSLLVKIYSLQLIEASSGKTLINVLFESGKGRPIAEIANAFVNVLKQNTK